MIKKIKFFVKSVDKCYTKCDTIIEVREKIPPQEDEEMTVYYIDGFVVDSHNDNLTGEVTLERAKEIAKENNWRLLDEDLEEIK